MKSSECCTLSQLHLGLLDEVHLFSVDFAKLGYLRKHLIITYSRNLWSLLRNPDKTPYKATVIPYSEFPLYSNPLLIEEKYPDIMWRKLNRTYDVTFNAWSTILSTKALCLAVPLNELAHLYSSWRILKLCPNLRFSTELRKRNQNQLHFYIEHLNLGWTTNI